MSLVSPAKLAKLTATWHAANEAFTALYNDGARNGELYPVAEQLVNSWSAWFAFVTIPKLSGINDPNVILRKCAHCPEWLIAATMLSHVLQHERNVAQARRMSDIFNRPELNLSPAVRRRVRVCQDIINAQEHKYTLEERSLAASAPREIAITLPS
jgi:hypothetical protein